MRKLKKKYRILFLVELLFLILLIPGCFKEEKLIYSDSEVVLDKETGIVVYEGEAFDVVPGVYQVRLNGISQNSGLIYVQAFCQESTFRAMRCNGDPIFVGKESSDFEIYVTDQAQGVYITCSLSGDRADIDSIEVYRMNWGNRMLLFISGLVIFALNFLLMFREGVICGKITKDKQIVFWGLFASIMIAYFPYMTDYFDYGADIMFHWLRIEGLKETLMHGNQFPVRVQSYWLSDHGYAVSSFYGDLFLLLPALLRIIGFSLMNSYKMFVFAMMTATAVIAYYSFKQCTKNTYASLFGSILYMLLPYRIFNFYNRGAIGECLAMVFIPLIISGMYRLFTDDIETESYSSAKWQLIVGLSCVLQSHMISCELSVCIIFVICIIFYKKTFRKKTFIQFVEAAVVCLLVNMWFWLPLLQMMGSDKYLLNNIIAANIQDRGLYLAEMVQFYPNRGTAQTGMYHTEPVSIGAAMLLMLLFVLFASIMKRIFKEMYMYKNPYDGIVLFWCILILVLCGMSTNIFPWDFISNIPVIGILATTLQFPTRLFIVISALSGVGAAFFGLWFAYECKERMKDTYAAETVLNGCASVIMIIAVGSALYHVNDIAYTDEAVWLYNAENMGTVSVANGEYLLEGTYGSEYYYHGPEAEDGIVWWDYEKEGTQIEMSIQNHSDQTKYLELPLIGYKGYAVDAEADDVEMPYITEERGNHGDLRIAVPAGYEGELEVSYKGFISYRVAELISLLAVAGLVLFRVMKGRVQWKQKAKQ